MLYNFGVLPKQIVNIQILKIQHQFLKHDSPSVLTNTKRSYTIWYVIACNPYKIKGRIRNVRKEWGWGSGHISEALLGGEADQRF